MRTHWLQTLVMVMDPDRWIRAFSSGLGGARLTGLVSRLKVSPQTLQFKDIRDANPSPRLDLM